MERTYIKRTILKNIKIFINQNIYLNSLDSVFAGFLLVENYIYNVEIMFCYYDGSDWNKNIISVDVYLTLSMNGSKYGRFLSDIKVCSCDNNNHFDMLKNFTYFSVLNNG